jgi:hypothetical protein
MCGIVGDMGPAFVGCLRWVLRLFIFFAYLVVLGGVISLLFLVLLDSLLLLSLQLIA